MLYGFGFGLPTSTLVNGSSTQSGTLPLNPTFAIGGMPVSPDSVEFAGVIGPGLYQFNVVVAGTVAGGDNLVICTYNGSQTTPGYLIAIQN